ncbi:MAG: DUF669 domain-containing protein [Aerococcus sp.]|nr:DUF669 domain-containing protein [Aerococcus sp.]
MDTFKLDYSNLDNGKRQVIPEGTYELLIDHGEVKGTSNGNELIDVTFIVRNDLDQVPELKETNGKYHNWKVYGAIFQDQETHRYSPIDLGYYMRACGVPDGTAINGMQHFLDLMQGKPVKAFVSQRKSTYQGQKQVQNRVYPNRLEVTNYPTVNHKGKTTQAQPQADDLPF